MSQAFDKYEKLGAYHYDWYDDPNYAWYKVCVDRCVDFCGLDTIDIGGGDGLIAKKLAEKGITPLVLENSKEAIKLGEKYAFYRFVDLDDENELHEHNYEYVCSLNVIEHLKTPTSHIRLIKNANKGAIIITDMPTENKGRYHEHEYTKKELLDTFAEFKPKYFVINSTEFGKPIQFHGVEIKK